MYLKSVHAFYNIHTTQSNRIWQIAVEYVRDNQKLFSRYEEQLLPKRKEKRNIMFNFVIAFLWHATWNMYFRMKIMLSYFDDYVMIVNANGSNYLIKNWYLNKSSIFRSTIRFHFMIYFCLHDFFRIMNLIWCWSYALICIIKYNFLIDI